MKYPESIESLRNKLEFIKDAMLVEAEFDVSFDTIKKFDVDDQKIISCWQTVFEQFYKKLNGIHIIWKQGCLLKPMNI